jgi:hypothetical protein
MTRYIKQGILIIVVFHFIACIKFLEPESKKLYLNGKITDDITGESVTGNGSIRVDGHDANAGTWFGIAYHENIGSGTIQNDGTFECSFKAIIMELMLFSKRFILMLLISLLGVTIRLSKHQN